MARVILQPARADIGLFRDQYDEFTRDLEAAGYTVLIEPAIEYRSGGAELGQAIFNLVVQVVGDLEEEAVGAIIALAAHRLRGTLRGRRRRVQVIWGPRGEHLREVNLPTNDDE